MEDVRSRSPSMCLVEPAGSAGATEGANSILSSSADGSSFDQMWGDPGREGLQGRNRSFCSGHFG